MDAASNGQARAAWEAAEAALSQARALIEAAGRQRPEPRSDADRLAAALIDEVAYNAAVLWNQTHDLSFDVTPLLTASLEARAGGAARSVARNLMKLRASCDNALAAAGAAVGDPEVDGASLPKPLGMPSFDSARCIPQTVLAKPMFAFLGRWRLTRAARRVLARSSLRTRVCDAMTEYLMRVEAWRLKTLNELQQRFVAMSARLRTRRTSCASEPTDDRARAIEEDLGSFAGEGQAAERGGK